MRISSNQPKRDLSKARTIGPRILRLAIPHKGMLIFGFIGLILGSAVNLGLPLLLRNFLSGDLGLDLEGDLAWFTALLISLLSLQGIFFFIRHYCFVSVGHRIVSGLRSQLFAKLLSLDIAFFERSQVGELLSRLTADSQLLQNAATTTVSVVLRYSIQVLAGTALMFYISPRLFVLILVVIPVLMISLRVWGGALARISKRMQEAVGEATNVADESLSNIRTVRSFTRGSFEIIRYNRAISKTLDLGLERTRTAAMFSSSMTFFLNAVIALVFFYGAHLVLKNQLSIADLTGFILYCVIVAASLGFLLSAADEFFLAVGAGERVFEILDTQASIVAPSIPKPFKVESGVAVRFSDVTFIYPSRPDRTVLKSVSFEIPTGRSVAIVGPSGAGKSTVVALLLRFHDPVAGSIQYRGTNLSEIDPNLLLSEISFVPQETELFSLTLEENIRYGRQNASAHEVLNALEVSQLSTFVRTLPDGLQTLIGEKGVQLSGGQRQRVAIARAVLKNPKLLILDEATSALDSESEHLVQQALNNLMKGRTTLIIAHRMSTIQSADHVLVLKDGELIEQGTHESLFGRDTFYRSLVQYQLFK